MTNGDYTRTLHIMHMWFRFLPSGFSTKHGNSFVRHPPPRSQIAWAYFLSKFPTKRNSPAAPKIMCSQHMSQQLNTGMTAEQMNSKSKLRYAKITSIVYAHPQFFLKMRILLLHNNKQFLECLQYQ